MEEVKPFQTKDYAASGSYDCEFSGRPIRAVGLRFAATVAGSAATFRDDAAFRLLRSPEINQAENPLVRMSGASWRHLSAIIGGSYDKHTASATAALAMATLDFERMVPGAMINAADKKCFLRGDFSALADFSGTAPTGVTGKIRPFAVTSQRNPSNGFLRPKITEVAVPVVAAAEDQQHVIRFEQDLVVLGLMVQAFDASNFGRSDGLVKSLRLDATDIEAGAREVSRQTWGQIRAYTQFKASFTPEDYDRSTGVGFLPTFDRRNPQWNSARLFHAGDSLTMHIDTSSTAEEEYTGVAPAASDQLIVTIVGFTPVAGSGDAAASIADASRSGGALSAVTARTRRSARRASRGM